VVTTRSSLATLAVVTLLAVPHPARAAPPPPDVDRLLARMDDLYRSTSSIARMEITVTTPRNVRTLRIQAWTRGEDDALIVVEAPAREAGTATLRVGENLWNWLPRIARTIRVPPSMMLGSWMGTDFTNDDLVKESSLRKDFAARVDRRSDAPAGWWLRLEAKEGVVGRWARIDLLVGDDDLPIEERHFDRKGRLARTMRFDEPRTFGGRRLPARMVLVPEGDPGKRTEMRYLEARFDVSLPADVFSLSRLERSR
jgi:outer membrane lipoprotein-sorting protein